MEIKTTKTEGTGKTVAYSSMTVEVESIKAKVTIPQQDTGAVKAYASITANIPEIGEIVVTGIKVIEGQNGLFVTMPNRKGNDGEYHDVVFPITAEGRKTIQETVLAAYASADATGKGSADGGAVGQLVVNGIKVINGANGLFTAMPQRQGSDGEYHDVAFPVTADGRKAINEAVIDAYKA